MWSFNLIILSTILSQSVPTQAQSTSPEVKNYCGRAAVGGSFFWDLRVFNMEGCDTTPTNAKWEHFWSDKTFGESNPFSACLDLSVTINDALRSVVFTTDSKNWVIVPHRNKNCDGVEFNPGAPSKSLFASLGVGYRRFE
jgi:hypothetical protein